MLTVVGLLWVCLPTVFPSESNAFERQQFLLRRRSQPSVVPLDEFSRRLRFVEEIQRTNEGIIRENFDLRRKLLGNSVFEDLPLYSGTHNYNPVGYRRLAPFEEEEQNFFNPLPFRGFQSPSSPFASPETSHGLKFAHEMSSSSATPSSAPSAAVVRHLLSAARRSPAYALEQHVPYFIDRVGSSSPSMLWDANAVSARHQAAASRQVVGEAMSRSSPYRSQRATMEDEWVLLSPELQQHHPHQNTHLQSHPLRQLSRPIPVDSVRIDNVRFDSPGEKPTTTNFDAELENAHAIPFGHHHSTWPQKVPNAAPGKRRNPFGLKLLATQHSWHHQPSRTTTVDESNLAELRRFLVRNLIQANSQNSTPHSSTERLHVSTREETGGRNDGDYGDIGRRVIKKDLKMPASASTVQYGKKEVEKGNGSNGDSPDDVEDKKTPNAENHNSDSGIQTEAVANSDDEKTTVWAVIDSFNQSMTVAVEVPPPNAAAAADHVQSTSTSTTSTTTSATTLSALPTATEIRTDFSSAQNKHFEDGGFERVLRRRAPSPDGISKEYPEWIISYDKFNDL